jgi:hypothetical protein
MNIKINWGWGIVIFLLIFVGSVGYRIFIAAQQQINLVTPDYYPKGITHEEEILKKANYEALSNKLEVKQSAGSLIVAVPGQKLNAPMSGTILIYRPSDFKEDSLFSFHFSDSIRTYNISTDFMKKGLYEVQVDWHEDSIFYYAVESVYISK